MADTFKGIITADGKKRQLLYGNVLGTPVSDETLSIQGAFADAKVVGDNFKKTKTETDSLKEDVSNKITKFYASNQGETHLADSDNGKIMDMMLYGKSSQDGTPSPENPVEIKSVVNPTVKVCGKNLLKATLQTATDKGVTCTNNGDGTYTLNGTATGDAIFVLNDKLGLEGKFKIIGAKGISKTGYTMDIYSKEWKNGERIPNDGYVVERQIQIIRIIVVKGTTCNNILYKPMITTDLSAAYDDFEPYHEQTVTLPYTLNAIHVSSGGNVIINGQQYIADYVDVERGKLVRCIGKKTVNGTESYSKQESWADSACVIYEFLMDGIPYRDYSYIADIASDILTKNAATAIANDGVIGIASAFNGLFICLGDEYNTIEKTKEYFSSNNTDVYYVLNAPTEVGLTPEKIQAFKALATYYQATNISVNSEQLDGYTVFNYPISMQNGWNYVKQQLNDNRDYIYDMDLQSAKAYVNSEYAVVLTELEV